VITAFAKGVKPVCGKKECEASASLHHISESTSTQGPNTVVTHLRRSTGISLETIFTITLFSLIKNEATVEET
jgi:hypothetical protein